jgi:hypothetical protein
MTTKLTTDDAAGEKAAADNGDPLIKSLNALGVHLYLDGEQLRYRAPAGAMTEELKQSIQDHRAALTARLRAEIRAKLKCLHNDPENFVDSPPQAGRIRTTCRVCGAFIGYRPAK